MANVTGHITEPVERATRTVQCVMGAVRCTTGSRAYGIAHIIQPVPNRVRGMVDALASVVPGLIAAVAELTGFVADGCAFSVRPKLLPRGTVPTSIKKEPARPQADKRERDRILACHIDEPTACIARSMANVACHSFQPSTVASGIDPGRDAQ
jgi:hypothetical protein